MALLLAQGGCVPRQNLTETHISSYTPKRIAVYLEDRMHTDTTPRWAVSVSKDTDIVVRSFSLSVV
jgi:hypothetical protein